MKPSCPGSQSKIDHERSGSKQASHRISKSWRPRARKENVLRAGQTAKASGSGSAPASCTHVLGRGRDRETREGPFILCVARCALHSRVRCGGATTFSRVSAKSSCRWRMAAWMKFQGRPWSMCRGINTVLPLRSALKNSISSSILNIHIRHVFTLGFCTYLFVVPLNLLCIF